MRLITYDEIRRQAPEFYEMTMAGDDGKVVEKVVNRGIDSRLEACFVPRYGDSYDWKTEIDIAPCERFPNGASVGGPKLVCRVSKESLPVLIRRLVVGDGLDDDEMDRAASIAEDILSSIGIHVDACCYDLANTEIDVVPGLSDRIEGLSPESYASLFGCETRDGVMFYNFTTYSGAEFLMGFVPAIERTIELFKGQEDDVAGLTKLKSIVEMRLRRMTSVNP